jgi:inorganic pyrophosphatase
VAVGRGVIVLPAVEIPKDSIAKYETALQDGRNPADRPTGRTAEGFKAKYIIESTQTALSRSSSGE